MIKEELDILRGELLELEKLYLETLSLIGKRGKISLKDKEGIKNIKSLLDQCKQSYLKEKSLIEINIPLQGTTTFAGIEDICSYVSNLYTGMLSKEKTKSKIKKFQVKKRTKNILSKKNFKKKHCS